MKKLISIILSIIMVVSMVPFATVTAYAAPPTKKQATSVAAASSYYIHDLWAEDECYYFDSVEEALDYVNQYPFCDTVTLLKDIDVDEPIVFNDADPDGNSDYLFFELDGHTITANNGDALVLNNLARYVFIDYYQSAFETGDYITGYGSIKAEGYAISANTTSQKNVLVEGGSFYSATMDCPIFATAGNMKVALRHGAIIAGDNTVVTNNISVGTNGNVYLQDSNGTNPSTSKHMTTTTVGEDTVYVIGDHTFKTTTESIAADRQSATISSKCLDCGYIKEAYPAVALVGDTAYASFMGAVYSIADGQSGTVEVLTDISASNITAQNGTSITIDLNGHTMTHPNGYLKLVGGELVFKDGTINSNSNMTFLMQGSTDATVERYSSLTLDNITLNNTYIDEENGYIGTAIFLDNPGWGKPYKYYGITLDVKDSVINCEGECIANNGNYANLDEFNTTKINISDSTLTSDYATALYMAGYAICNTTNTTYNGVISGAEIRAGIFNVLGDENEFNASYDGMTEVVSNKSGTTTTGAALAITQHNLQPNPNPVKVNIYGGTYNGTTALIESQVQNIPASQQDVTIKIYDGEFNGTDSSVIVDSCTDFISGGQFSVDPNPSYIEGGRGTRLDENDMYVLTDLDYYAYRAAVQTAKSIDRSLYTDESLSALDAVILPEYSLNTQQDINNATADVQTKYSELVYRAFNVRFVVETADGTRTTTDNKYQYNQEVRLDVSYLDEEVYKWTIEQGSSTKKLPTDSKVVNIVVKGDAEVTVYTSANTTESPDLTKVTYLSNKDKTIGLDYVENVQDSIPPEAPEIPFYDFAGWEQVDDTTFKATYHYNSGYCKFVGGINVVVENGGNVSTNNDAGIDVPYDDVVRVSSSVEGQLALSANKEGTQILTYINDVATIHAPKRESVWVIVLPKVQDATVGITGGYVKFVDDVKKKVAVNGQYYLPEGCKMVDTGAVLCNKHNDFEIGGAGVVKLVSTMQSSSNEFTVALTTNYGTMDYIYARTYLTYTDSNGNTKTIYSKVKAISLASAGNID